MRLKQDPHPVQGLHPSDDKENTQRDLHRARAQAVLEGKLHPRQVLGDRPQSPTFAPMATQNRALTSRWSDSTEASQAEDRLMEGAKRAPSAASKSDTAVRGEPSPTFSTSSSQRSGASPRRAALDLPMPVAPAKGKKLRHARNSIDLDQPAARSRKGQQRREAVAGDGMNHILLALGEYHRRNK